MLVQDRVYEWEGFGGKLKLASGRCRLQIYDLTRESARGAAPLHSTLVIVSDVPDSPMSVRSCAGHVATAVARDFKIEPHRMLFVEYTPPSVYGEHGERVVPERYLAVDFNWTEGGAIQPKWRILAPPLLDRITRIVAGAQTRHPP